MRTKLKFHKDNYSHPKIHAIGRVISVVKTATTIKIKNGIPVNIAKNAKYG